MRVSAAIKSIIHGVTTDNLVNADSRHMAAQVNTITRVDEGLTKRPPADHVGSMGVTLGTDEFVKEFSVHDTTYFIVFRKSPLAMEVVREDGISFAVVDDADDLYLDTTVEADVEITVHGEQVFIVNKTTTVSTLANSDVFLRNSLLFVKSVVEPSYKIRVAWTNDSGIRKEIVPITVGAVPSNGTDNIATQIATAVNLVTNGDVSATSGGSVVQFVRGDGEWAEVTAETDVGVTDQLVVMNGVVDEFSDLPRFAYHGHLTKVQPIGASDDAAVYMQAVAESYIEELDSSPTGLPDWGTPDLGGITMYWSNASFSAAAQYRCNGDGLAPELGSYSYFVADIPEGTPYLDGQIEWYMAAVADVDGNVSDNNFHLEFMNLEVPSVIVGGTCDYTYECDQLRFAVEATPDVTAGHAFGYISDSTSAVHLTERGVIVPIAHTLVGGVDYGMWLNRSSIAPSVAQGIIQCRWIEAQEPGLTNALDNSSMPHLLTPHLTADWVLSGAAWDVRRAGDNSNNPMPTFVGKTIEDIIVFQNRLSLLSDDEYSASASGNVFNFFRDTVTELLSKHPINIRSTSADSSRLRHFVYHNRDLFMTAGRQQYKIDGSIPLTPQTASMQMTTSYNASETISPISLGDSVYLPNHQGDYLGVSKYEGSSQDLAADSADSITQHVRKYIPGTTTMIDGLPNHGLLFALDIDGQEVYVCNYDANKSRAEDKRFAWFKWDDFNSVGSGYKIVSMGTSKNTLFLVIDSQTGLSLLKMDMDAGAQHYYMDYYDSVTVAASLVTLPTSYHIYDWEDIVIVQGVGCPSPGDYCTVVSGNIGAIVIEEDMGGGTVHVGREFTVQAVPNIVSVRDEGGNVNNAANLRINKFEIRVRDTGIMTATERSPYDTYETQEFTGLVSGSLDAITDQEATTTEVFKVGFKQHADKGTLLIESKSWLPMTITQIDWRGNYKSRGRRF